MSGPPAVEVRGLGHAYGDRVVFRDLDLDVPPGTSLALFGANGAGKTTLLRALVGLLRPTVGSVQIGGAEAASPEPEVRRRIGYVGHRPLVWSGLTAVENVRLFSDLYGLAPAAADAALERVGLERRRDDLARDLSQGMRQRLSLARALVHGPDFLVLDEPHSGLDADGVALLDGVLDEARGQATVILATHDRERGAALCDATLTLAGGGLR